MIRRTVSDVRTALEALAAEQPDRVDRRPGDRLAPRYVEHGEPNCLVAVLLNRLGVSIGVLKQLDREAGGWTGGGIILRLSRHAIRRRFTPAAWDLLDFLQRWNDDCASWGKARDTAFRTPWDSYWGDHPRHEWRSWMTEE